MLVPPGDVAGVAHHGADVAGVNLLVQRLALPAAHGVEKVADVSLLADVAAAFLHDLAGSVVSLPRGVGEQQPAILTVDDRALARAEELRRGDHEGVNARVGKQVAVVLHELGFAAGFLLHLRAALFADGVADVADV